MDVKQTVTAFCREKERWCKEQGRQGRQGPLLGSPSADVQDPGLGHQGLREDLYHWVPIAGYLGWTLQESMEYILALL